MADNQDIKQNIDISFSTNAEQEAKKVDKVANSQQKIIEKQKELDKVAKARQDVYSKITDGIDKITGGMVSGFKSVMSGIKTATLATQGFSKALVATGIGAIIVAFGLLVTYWEDIKSLVSGVSSEQTKLNEKLEKQVDLEKKKLQEISDQENVLKNQGKSEKEILQMKNAQIDAVIKATEAQIEQAEITKKAQVEAAERNQKITAGIVAFLMSPITILLKTVDTLTYGLEKLGLIEKATNFAEEGAMWVGGLVFDPEEVAKEGQKTIDEQKASLDKLKNDKAGFELSIKNIDKQAIEEQKRLAKERKALLDKQKAERDAFLKQIKDLENTYLKGIEDLNDKSENQKLERQKQRDLEAIENLRKQGANVAELLRLNAEKYAILEKELAERQEKERKELEQKRIDDRRAFDEQYYNGIREFQDAQNAQEIEAVRKHKEDLLKIEKETALRKIEIEGGTPEEIAEKTAQLNEYYRQRELDNNKAADDAMLAQKQAITDQLRALEEQGFATAKMLFEKNKGIQKGILIAENAIALARVGQNTAAGISKAMAKGLPTGPVEAGIIGASGALSAINIIAATAKGLKALGGGSAGDAGVKSNVPKGGQEPQVGFQNSSENQIANTINRSQQEMPPIQTYVVSQEVTNNQQIDRNRQASNSF